MQAVSEKVDELTAAIAQPILIVAANGSGKTTQLPKLCLAEPQVKG